MAIAFDTSVNGLDNGGSAATHTWSHTIGAGADRYIFIAFEGDNTIDDIASVKVNGVAIPLIVKANGSNDRWYYVYGQAAPAAGAATILITANSAHYLFGVSASYTGVQGLSGSTTTNGGAASLTTSLTTIVDNSWMVLFAVNGVNTQPTAGTGATARQSGQFNAQGWFDSQAVTPAGSKSMTIGGPTLMGHLATLISPAGSTPAYGDSGSIALNVPHHRRGIRIGG